MIYIPTTDILTPITGEVEKPIANDHSETAAVSFLSVIAAEDTDADVLIAVSDQPQISQTQSPPQTDHVGFAATFPAYIIVPDTVPDLVLPPQGGNPPSTNQFETVSTTPILVAAELDGDRGNAQPALIGDERKKISATPPYLQDTRRTDLGAAPRTISDVPSQIVIRKGATQVPMVEKEATGNILRAATTDLPQLGGRLAGQPPNETPVLAQYIIAGPTKEANAGSAGVAQKNAPMVTPTNAVSPSTAPPKLLVDSFGGGQPFIDPPKVSAASQDKPTVTGQIPKAPQSQREPIAPKSVQPPVQGSAPPPIQVLFADLPVNSAEFNIPAHDQKIALKTDVAQPDLARTPAIPQLQNPSEAITIPKTSQKEIQAPVSGRQSQVKQGTEATPIKSAQLPPVGLAPQATLPPIAKQHTGNPNSGPTPVLQTPVSFKSNSTQPARSSDALPLVPVTDATKAETLEPFPNLEVMPFEAKSTDIVSPLRHDANVNRPEVMRHVAQQLVDVARQMPDRPVELALNPEELGRVRLTFTTTDGGIHIAVMAERGETMDLLRRHIETLAQEFREMGYKDVNFEFSQNRQNDAQKGETDAQSRADPDAEPTQTQSLAPVQLSLEPSAGLDLRL